MLNKENFTHHPKHCKCTILKSGIECVTFNDLTPLQRLWDDPYADYVAYDNFKTEWDKMKKAEDTPAILYPCFCDHGYPCENCEELFKPNLLRSPELSVTTKDDEESLKKLAKWICS